MRLTRRLRRQRRVGALAGAQLSVLGELARLGERTPRQLADADRVMPQTMTRTLAELEGDGLVYRRRDLVDRRRSWIGLTDRGVGALGGDMAERDRWLDVQIERLSPAERAVLRLATELIDKLADDVDAGSGPLDAVAS